MSVINIYVGTPPVAYYSRVGMLYCAPPPKSDNNEEALTIFDIVRGYRDYVSKEINDNIPYLDTTEGVICYLFGGSELTSRVTRGIAASALSRPGMSSRDVINAKRSTNIKIISSLRENLFSTPTTPIFMYFCLQGLSYTYRVVLLIIVIEESVFLIENNVLLPCDPNKLFACISCVLSESATLMSKKNSFESLFGTTPPKQFFTSVPCSCLQLQTNSSTQSVLRRWYTVLSWTCSTNIYLSRVLTSLMHSQKPSSSIPDSDNILSVYDDKDTPAFSIQSYERMRDDRDRTLGYERAIKSVCKNKICLEIGTGPFALLSIMAVKAGALHVYAVEADRQAVESAMKYIKTELSNEEQSRITILPGLSTDVSLPENTLAEVVIHELIGVIASEEGVIETINDAANRLLKTNYLSIPHKVCTKISAFSIVGNHPIVVKRNDYSLGIGLDLERSCSTVGEVENIVFSNGMLPKRTTDIQSKVELFIKSGHDVDESSPIQLGIWIELHLLQSDRDSQIVSSLKDCSSWPKVLCNLTNAEPVGETKKEKYSSLCVEYSVSKRSVFAFEFLVTGKEKFTLCHEVEKMDLWYERVLSKKGKLTTTVSSSLSPLHKAVVFNDGCEISCCGHEPRFWKILDPIFGLSPMHLYSLLKPNIVIDASLDMSGGDEVVRTVNLFSSVEKRNIMTHSDARFGIESRNIARLMIKNLETEAVLTSVGDISVLKFKEITGRELIKSTIHGYDFIVDVWLKLRPESVSNDENNEKLIFDPNDNSIKSSRNLKCGDVIGMIQGITTHLSDSTPDSFPFPSVPYTIDVSSCCNVLGLIKYTHHGNCTIVPKFHSGTLSLSVEAASDINFGEPLTLNEES